MEASGENEGQADDNDLKTSNLVEEQRTKAIKTDLAKLEMNLEEERKRNEEYLTSLRYLQADFENYRKRVEKDMKETGENSSRRLVARLLSVLDELDLATAHSKGGAPDDELREGVLMVQKNLLTALESEGLERIEAVGRAFDPALHEAVTKVQGAARGQDMVVEEFRSGYTFRGRVIRPSMVKVELAMKEQVEEGDAVE